MTLLTVVVPLSLNQLIIFSSNKMPPGCTKLCPFATNIIGRLCATGLQRFATVVSILMLLLHYQYPDMVNLNTHFHSLFLLKIKFSRRIIVFLQPFMRCASACAESSVNTLYSSSVRVLHDAVTTTNHQTSEACPLLPRRNEHTYIHWNRVAECFKNAFTYKYIQY